ncbi:hypothetical protein [Promicromonospora iranensis]|uniref:Uncharacterized protein n=1 Tax=Promicromonospora iranensis TaxID=1105144 RepID=A0ABU2CMU5_9MICO|nr:hypothetical protein [Promicromonospora iranensis]MDR7382642.1 hypothetical protein [Promicromonospora iranensis]
MEQQGTSWRPWDEDQVFTFPEREDWIFWVTGMGDGGAEEIAATREWGAGNPAVIGAIQAMDQDAVEDGDGNAWGAGVWLPAEHGHQVRAGVLIKTFPDRGHPKKAYRKFRKQAARVPQVPGVTITGYDVDEGEVDFGPLVVQGIDTVNDAGEVQIYWFVTLFSDGKDEVVRLEFQTLYAHLSEEIGAQVSDLISHAYYGVKPGSALSKELGLE